ncbi:hypothetical protein KI387_006547, partial [Taxus chinensis]
DCLDGREEPMEITPVSSPASTIQAHESTTINEIASKDINMPASHNSPLEPILEDHEFSMFFIREEREKAYEDVIISFAPSILG